MKVNVLNLLLENEKFINVDIEEAINSDKLKDDRFEVIAPIKLTGKLVLISDVVRFEGTLETTCKFVCDRCLDEFISDLEVDFSEEFKQGVTIDDEDFLPIVNDMIDFDSSIIKNILINIPIQIVCSEECPGIQYIPKENDEKKESPFDVLKNLDI